MNTNPNNHKRDQVLFAFHQAYVRPTAEQISEWVDLYPQFAEDIRAHAVVSHEWEACDQNSVQQADETMRSRALSNALNALYKAEHNNAGYNNSAAPHAPSRSFHDILFQHGKQIFQVASELNIARSVLADLFNGWMNRPIRSRLVNGVSSSLLITLTEFEKVLDEVLRNPRLGHAKSEGVPTILRRSCGESIRQSNMTEERKRYWLEEI